MLAIGRALMEKVVLEDKIVKVGHVSGGFANPRRVWMASSMETNLPSTVALHVQFNAMLDKLVMLTKIVVAHSCAMINIICVKQLSLIH
jgi:hypothetical protein